MPVVLWASAVESKAPRLLSVVEVSGSVREAAHSSAAVAVAVAVALYSRASPRIHSVRHTSSYRLPEGLAESPYPAPARSYTG